MLVTMDLAKSKVRKKQWVAGSGGKVGEAEEKGKKPTWTEKKNGRGKQFLHPIVTQKEKVGKQTGRGNCQKRFPTVRKNKWGGGGGNSTTLKGCSTHKHKNVKFLRREQKKTRI